MYLSITTGLSIYLFVLCSLLATGSWLAGSMVWWVPGRWDHYRQCYACCCVYALLVAGSMDGVLMYLSTSTLLCMHEVVYLIRYW